MSSLPRRTYGKKDALQCEQPELDGLNFSANGDDLSSLNTSAAAAADKAANELTVPAQRNKIPKKKGYGCPQWMFSTRHFFTTWFCVRRLQFGNRLDDNKAQRLQPSRIGNPIGSTPAMLREKQRLEREQVARAATATYVRLYNVILQARLSAFSHA